MRISRKILILSDKVDKTLFHNIQKYTDNAVYTSSYRWLIFRIQTGKVAIFDSRNNVDLDSYDLVYFKQYGLETRACATYLQAKGIPFLNQDLGSNYIYNKLDQYILLGCNNFLLPDSIYTSHQNLIEIAKDNTYPFILKSITSSLGNDNYLIQNYEQLREVLCENPKTPFVMQEYIPNDFDYRVLVLGHKVGTVLKRQRRDASDHRNNAYLGAQEEEVIKPDKSIIEISVKTSRLLNKDIAGIDLIFDEKTKQYYIIELNSKPLFTYDTRISSEVPQFTKYIDHYLEKKPTS